MTLHQVASEHVRSGDVDIFYRMFGKPGGTPVLIVHGLSYFSYDWIEAGTLIAKDREVVAIDMRGFGESDWSPARDYKLETLSNDVIAVLDALGWSKAVLMGHSFGGRVCLATAGWKPERAAGLLLVDFAPDIAASGRRYTAQRIGSQPDVFASIEEAMAYEHENPADAGRRARWAAFLTKTDQGYALKRDLHYRDNFRKALESGQSAPVPAFLWPMLTDIRVPTMVIRGSESNMLEAATLDKIKQLNPRAATVELAGSHDLAGDNPEGLAKLVNEFFAANSL
jgi:pimeloyl-ACP methyl ester carboxylesterase